VRGGKGDEGKQSMVKGLLVVVSKLDADEANMTTATEEKESIRTSALNRKWWRGSS
jgi:hypothetical protein